MSNDPLWQVSLLGGLTARSSARLVRFRARHRAGLLLAALLLEPSRACSREQLIERFWPEADSQHGRQSLRSLLSALRDLLEPSGIPAGTVLVASRVLVRLEPSAIVSDVCRFRQLVSEAHRDTEPSSRVPLLQEAISLYVGELLPGFYDDWIEQERQRLADEYVHALDRLVTDQRAVAGAEAALPYAHLAAAAEPLDERRARILLQLQIEAGHITAAARTYRSFRRRTRQQLGVAPSAELRRLAAGLKLGGTAAAGTARHGRAEAPLARPRRGGAHRAAPCAGNLPVQFTRFVGRDDELAILRQWLDPSGGPAGPRIVTVTGPGGVGKTRLAIEAARSLEPAYRGAVWCAALADTTDPGAIASVVLAAMGLPARSEGPSADPIAGALDGKGGLLLLDNLEQMGAPGGLAVAALAAQVPSARFLVTSRRRLLVPGERVLTLRSLPTPQAGAGLDAVAGAAGVALFVDRAQAVDEAFGLTPANADAVAELCRRLEGLPLAIEMAAARADVLTPARMLEHLDERFEFLRRRPSQGPARQLSLWHACDWSYQLLAPSLRYFFAHLSVFRGSFTAEAADAVCGSSGSGYGVAETTERLLRLTACSLVMMEDSDDGKRFRMLETLREFAERQLSAREREAGMCRLAAYVDSWVASLRAPGWLTEAVARRVDLALPDVRAAVEWGLAGPDLPLALRIADGLTEYWQARGRTAEWYGWLRRALASGDRLDRAALVGLLRCAAIAALGAGDAEGARALHGRLEALLAEEFPQALEPFRHEAGTLATEGVAAHMAEDYAAARDLLDRALAAARQSHDPGPVACNLAGLGEALEALGRYDEASRAFEECLSLARDSESRAYPLCQAAGFLCRRGEFLRAEEALAEALALYRTHGDRPGIAICRRGQGMVALERADYGVAGALFEESLALWRDVDPACAGVADLLGCMGALARRTGDAEEAKRRLEASLELWRRHGHARWQALALVGLAAADADAGSLAAAEALCLEALGLARPGAYDTSAHAAHHTLGRIALARHDLPTAARRLAESLRERVRCGLRPRVAETLEVAAALLVARGQGAAAARALGAADALRSAMGAPVPPCDQASRAAADAAVGSALGADAFAVARAAGASSPWEAAADEALRLLEETATAGNL